MNVHSGQVDARHTLIDAAGNEVSLEQTEKELLLHDKSRGTVTSVDLRTHTETAQRDVTQGATTSVAIWKNAVVMLERETGTLRLLDPTTLSRRGDPVSLGSKLVAGGFDNNGTLWVAADNSVIGVTADTAKGTLRVVTTRKIGIAKHDIALTVLDDGVAVLDATADVATIVDRNSRLDIEVPGLEKPRVADRTTGSVIAVTQPNARSVLLIGDDGVRSIGVAGQGELGLATVFDGKIYLFDTSGHHILVVDMSGNITDEHQLRGDPDHVNFHQQQGRLVVDSPDNDALLIDKTDVRTVQKQPDQTEPPTEPTEPVKDPAPKNTGPGNGNQGSEPQRPTSPRSPAKPRQPAPSTQRVPSDIPYVGGMPITGSGQNNSNGCYASAQGEGGRTTNNCG